MSQRNLYEEIGIIDGVFPKSVSGFNFNNIAIKNMDLSFVLFTRCSFVNTRFEDCDMSYAMFVHCNMEGSHSTGNTKSNGLIVATSCTGYGIRSDYLEWLDNHANH